MNTQGVTAHQTAIDILGFSYGLEIFISPLQRRQEHL
jgi:hypothetical protein